MNQAHLIKRCAGGDEKSLIILASEANIGRTLRHLNRLQLFTVCTIHLHVPVGRVEIPFHIHGHAVTAFLDFE